MYALLDAFDLLPSLSARFSQIIELAQFVEPLERRAKLLIAAFEMRHEQLIVCFFFTLSRLSSRSNEICTFKQHQLMLNMSSAETYEAVARWPQLRPHAAEMCKVCRRDSFIVLMINSMLH